MPRHQRTAIYISIHALREEGDRKDGDSNPRTLLTISIHALREEGDFSSFHNKLLTLNISIHALREEGDIRGVTLIFSISYFYPRPPRGGRRLGNVDNTADANISIHALREEGDYLESFAKAVLLYFYPRPPRGGRPECKAEMVM